jgi:hypothetical protein
VFDEEDDNSVESYYDNSVDNDPMDSDGKDSIAIKTGDMALTFQSMSESVKTQFVQQVIKYVSGFIKKFQNIDQ